MRDRFPEGTTSPRRLGEDDLKVHAREFERTEFTGALNRDRNMDRDRADPAAWDGAVIRQPSRYVAGELDASTTWLAAAIADHPRTLPGLVGQHVLEGRGHWIQQEAPEEVGRLLVEWLAGL